MDFTVDDATHSTFTWTSLLDGLYATSFIGEEQPIIVKAIGAFRYYIWQNEGYTPAKSDERIWLDKFDEKAVHWIVCQNASIIGSARLTIHKNLEDIPDAEDFIKLTLAVVPPIACINRLVVSPTMRGKGIASWLDRQRILKAQEFDAKTILGEVLETRVPAIVKHGFVKIGTAQGKLFPETEWHLVMKCLA